MTKLMQKEKPESIVIPYNDFRSNRHKVIEMDSVETDTTINELNQYQPNMMDYFMEFYNNPEIYEDLKIEVFVFLSALWLTIKDYPNVKTQKITLDELQLCYHNNLAYLNLMENVTNIAEYEEIVKNATAGYRQIEIFLYLFNFDASFYHNFKEHDTSSWFCILKTNIDVIDKLINNEIITINL